MEKQRVTVTGDAALRVARGAGARGPVLANRILIEIDPAGGVTWIIHGHPDLSAAPETVVSPTREVRYHVGQVIAALERAAYAARPITPLLKPKPRKPGPPRRPPGSPRMTVCPACRNFDPRCGYCDGEGEVSERQAEEWRDTHADDRG